MAKKIKEQIDYGDTPERMDPSLERKISSPESPFATNPAFRKGEKDVQRLMTNRFKQVADKLRDVTGRPITSQQVGMMIYMQQMQNIQTIMNIERSHKEELEQLAIDASLDEIQMPDDWFEINANLGAFEAPEFKMGKPGEITATVEPEMDVEMEKHKRNLINAIIQGTSKKGHYVFQKPEVRSRLNDIDPRLYPAYLSIMTINDFMYFTMEEMIEMMSESGQGIGGAVKLESSSDDDKKTSEKIHLLKQRKGSKMTKAKEGKMERAIKQVKRKAERKSLVKFSTDFLPIDTIYDAQSFCERLFSKLKKSNDKYEIKLYFLRLISRMIGRHKIQLLSFYPNLLRYLNSHNKDKISEIFAMIIESCHDLIPPENVKPIIERIISNYITEFCNN